MPNHAPRRSAARPIETSPDRVLHASREVRIGAFRCPLDRHDFATAGPIEGYTIGFPRTAVWIEHAGHPPFVADPGIVTIYNLGQRYRRQPLAPDGDRVDWFSVSRELAESLVADLDPEAAAAPGGPFPVPFARIPMAIYCHQRWLFNRIRRGDLHDPFEIEQEVTMLLGTVLRWTVGNRRRTRATPSQRHQDLVERTRATLAADPFRRSTVRDLAARVGTSPFHLCRIFHRATGLTLHHHQLEIRTRLAVERVEQGDSLSRVAFELGFSSHSHFTAEFRRRIGLAPSRLRTALAPPFGRSLAGQVHLPKEPPLVSLPPQHRQVFGPRRRRIDHRIAGKGFPRQ